MPVECGFLSVKIKLKLVGLPVVKWSRISGPVLVQSKPLKYVLSPKTHFLDSAARYFTVAA